jgi:hypothetical protein
VRSRSRSPQSRRVDRKEGKEKKLVEFSSMVVPSSSSLPRHLREHKLLFGDQREETKWRDKVVLAMSFDKNKYYTAWSWKEVREIWKHAQRDLGQGVIAGRCWTLDESDLDGHDNIIRRTSTSEALQEFIQWCDWHDDDSPSYTNIDTLVACEWDHMWGTGEWDPVLRSGDSSDDDD